MTGAMNANGQWAYFHTQDWGVTHFCNLWRWFSRRQYTAGPRLSFFALKHSSMTSPTVNSKLSANNVLEPVMVKITNRTSYGSTDRESYPTAQMSVAGPWGYFWSTITSGAIAHSTVLAGSPSFVTAATA